MTLAKILAKERLKVLGLNSGTSADGLDLALISIDPKVGALKIRFLRGAKKKYPQDLRNAILKLADSPSFDVDELVYLHNLVGEFAGRTARTFINRLPSGLSVNLIASHGQTVRHLPHKVKRYGRTIGGSLQIGSPEFIATATKLPVVSDFRQADIALGNEGAPITVAAMADLFASPKESRLIVNIGGVSNYFYFPRSQSGLNVRAADCGPGNSLCDILSLKLYRESYDRAGRHARRGRISENIVSVVMSEGFFAGRRISTGRESFGISVAEKIAKLGRVEGLAAEDLLATAAELTVRSIVGSVTGILQRDKSLSKLYLTGGGRYNIFIVDRLKQHLPSCHVLRIDDLGIDGDYVEAAAYAVMGEACLRSRVLATRFFGGGKQLRRPVLGRITQPPGRV